MSKMIIPEKPYFPFCLGNGVDSVMVDYSGSMHCDSGHLHLEQHEGAICCWEKITHRRRKRDMVPLVQFPYRLMGGDGELYEVGSFSQKFDPIRAVLQTEIDATLLRLKVETFLTSDHLYVERYTVLAADSSRRPQIVFLARKPFVNLSGWAIIMPKDMRVSIVLGKGNLITGEYAFDEVRGTLAMGVQSGSRPLKFLPDRIQVRDLKKGEVIVRFISLKDNTHGFEGDATTTVKRALRKGFDAVLTEHEKGWRDFHSKTRVELPDPDIQDIYRKSLWMIRASQNPKTGFITSGLYHAFKGGGYACYWDMIFAMRALLTANQSGSAKKLLDFYQSTVGSARAYAGEIGRSGVYFPWFANHQGKSLDFDHAFEFRDIQKWNNGCLALQLFDPYRFHGDREDLKKRLPLLQEVLKFLVTETVVEEGGDYFIKPLQGGDENIHRRNDTCHALSLIEGLTGLIEGCRVSGLPVPDGYQGVLDGLRKSLKRNYRNHILSDYEGGKEVSSASFIYHVLAQPEGITPKSLRAALKQSWGLWGLTNNGTYRNLIWPWTEGRAALAFSVTNPDFSFERLKHVVNFTSTHGIFPEKVRPDGFWVLFGYLTAHTTFVYAVNSLLACDDGKVLNVTVGIPAEWKNLSFEKVFTASGFGVSFSLKNGKVRKLVIENCRETKRSVKLRLLKKPVRTVDLLPGINRIL
jgi:hypothetical protein